MIAFALFALALQAGAAAPRPTIAGEGPGFPGLGVGHRPQVEIAWNRFYDAPEVYALLDRIEAAYPELVRHEVIGHSVENRELRVYTVTNTQTGDDRLKPAMWIDGNVHGNEVQGAEAAVYAVWYLCENQASNEAVRELLDGCAFYVLPMQNPDGRAHWFERAHNAHSSRSGVQPEDDDQDGLYDEDPPNDLDGDGHIVQMRKLVPGQGTHRLDPDDPRVLLPVPANEQGLRGDWIYLGQEGVDDDGDGSVNEDGVGGYDMNRAWPSLWQPEFVQRGSGPYPLYWPETRAIARFLLDHPNVAGVQSFHNSGGMILRGPGAESFGEYEAADVRVYDALGADGEGMLPFYRYWVIWKDLYTVYGGFVTWTYESLGIFSFTNELWSDDQYFPDPAGKERLRQGWKDREGERERLFFDDRLLMGAGYVDWHPFDHPLYGKVEIGGFKKDVGRVPPTFMIEEMLHRNALFCLRHAQSMPVVTIEDITVSDLGDGVRAVDVAFRNAHWIPTRSRQSSKHGIGTPDAFTCSGRNVVVIAGGFRSDRFRPERIELAEREPERLLREEGIPGRGEVRVRWLVRGRGETVSVGWQGEKARDVSIDVRIQ